MTSPLCLHVTLICAFSVSQKHCMVADNTLATKVQRFELHNTCGTGGKMLVFSLIGHINASILGQG